MGGYAADLEELMAQYRERRARAGELQRQIAAVTGTATAQRQTVKVTVNVQGEITALEFPTGAYKRMAPADLAEAITSTVEAARAKALETMKTMLLPEMPAGLNFMDLMQGKADVAAAVPAEPPMLDEVRDYINTGRAVPHSSRG
jgi:DNA-binding protein YbaB